MSKIQSTIEKVEDYLLGLAFKFWIWLGQTLDVSVNVTVPQPQPWIITKEVLVQGPKGETVYVTDPELVEERDQLLAEVQDLTGQLQGHIKGADRPNKAKLTAREVADIRYFKRAGWTNKSIAETYDVNPATISRIVRGQYYKVAA